MKLRHKVEDMEGTRVFGACVCVRVGRGEEGSEGFGVGGGGGLLPSTWKQIPTDSASNTRQLSKTIFSLQEAYCTLSLLLLL